MDIGQKYLHARSSKKWTSIQPCNWPTCNFFFFVAKRCSYWPKTVGCLAFLCLPPLTPQGWQKWKKKTSSKPGIPYQLVICNYWKAFPSLLQLSCWQQLLKCLNSSHPFFFSFWAGGGGGGGVYWDKIIQSTTAKILQIFYIFLIHIKPKLFNNQNAKNDAARISYSGQ